MEFLLKLPLLLLSLIFSQNIFASHDHGGATNDYENSTSGSQMYDLPIHFMIGLDGSFNFMFGYHGMRAGMGHMDMDGNMSSMPGNMNSDMGDSTGMDHMDDMDGMGDMDPGTETKPAWKYMLMPMISVGGDFSKKVINLQKRPVPKMYSDQSQQYAPKTLLNFTPNEESDKGYLVVKQWRTEVGAGAMVMTTPTVINWGLFINGGIMPYVGGWSYSEKYGVSKKDVKTIKKLRSPKNVEDLEHWSIRDKYSYSAYGGVMFQAGGGVPFLTNGFMYMAQGKWRVNLRKVGTTKINLTLSKEALHHFAVASYTLVSTVDIGYFKSIDKNFSFTFDLSEKSALEAYRHALRGNLTKAQNLLLSPYEFITQNTQGYGVTRGGMANFRVGIPFLGQAFYSVGKIKNISHQVDFASNMVMDNKIHMYMEEGKTSGVLSHHKKSLYSFMGMYMNMQFDDDKAKKMSHHMGTLNWVLENDHMRPRKLKRALERVFRRTGLVDEVVFDMPEKGDLGYLRAAMNMNINEKGLEAILNESMLADNLSLKLDEYFATLESPEKFCRIKVSARKCKRSLEIKLRFFKKKISKLLKNLKVAIKNDEYDNFAARYTELGRQMLKNPILFRSIIQKAGKENVEIYLDIMGEKIFKQSYKIEYKF